jgi:cell division protein FtsB
MPRTAFVVVVLGLLGCGLICLLVIYTTLAKSSYQINDLQQQNAKLAQQTQALQQQVAAEQAPGAIARRADQLGMRDEQVLRFIDLRTGRTFRQPADAVGVPAASQPPAPPAHARHPSRGSR